jgi:hypothetical protein
MEKSHKLGRRCLFVFDLDSTLYDVSPRLQKIIDNFADHPEHKSKFPNETNIIKTAKVLHSDWGVRASINRLSFDQPPPEELYQLVRDFWSFHFFGNDYLVHDKPYLGSVEFVQKLAALPLNDIAYLTGRDIQRMGTGSIESLKQHEFPIETKNTSLALKPHQDHEDTLFKSDWFGQIDQQIYDHIWFFENEPLNIHQVQVDHPHVKIIFFKSTHSGKGTEPHGLPTITDYL